jgi:hypothetical protein
MIEVEWRSPTREIRICSSLVQLVIIGCSETGRGRLGGKWRTIGWEGWGVCCGKPTPPIL